MKEGIVVTDRKTARVQVAQFGDDVGWQMCQYVLLDVVADLLRNCAHVFLDDKSGSCGSSKSGRPMVSPV
jgi:uncharacterized protein YbbK (DUF523 family)